MERAQSMGLKPGSRLKSRVSTAEFVIIRAGDNDVNLAAGGVDTVALESDAPQVGMVGDTGGEALLGKRYVDEQESFEVLCTKSGLGGLTIDGRPLQPKRAKPLPASD
jgi:hypothetical protein